MKKIVHGYVNSFNIFDPKDYIIIERYGQHISDKYVNLLARKINEYKDEDILKKGDVVIRVFYYIEFGYINTYVQFNKFKYYEVYRNSYELTSKLKQDIRMKNSGFYFDYVKERIVNIFSRNLKIKIS